MTKIDGGPAFPFSSLSPEGPSVYKDNEGMSLRDYFAAKAMVAEIATTCSDATPQAAEALILAANAAGRTELEQIAFNAYRMADAMIAERAR